VITLRETIGCVVRLRNVWLLCIATAGVSGCVNGMLGYLPMYLRGLNWPPASADSTLASFHAASLICAIPIALLSDRIGNRRCVLMVSVLLIGIGTGLLGFVGGVLISVAVLMAGITRDGFMAVTMTSIIEVRGVGARFAGTAVGLNISIMGIANFLAPPAGNWLATFGPGIPFLLWACLAVSGFVAYLFLQQPKAGYTARTLDGNRELHRPSVSS
jgi:MFS family permease